MRRVRACSGVRDPLTISATDSMTGTSTPTRCAISTTAEECENPQRDLPRSMMWAIIICTVLYITIALVLTGMVKYDQLAIQEQLSQSQDRALAACSKYHQAGAP